MLLDFKKNQKIKVIFLSLPLLKEVLQKLVTRKLRFPQLWFNCFCFTISQMIMFIRYWAVYYNKICSAIAAIISLTKEIFVVKKKKLQLCFVFNPHLKMYRFSKLQNKNFTFTWGQVWWLYRRSDVMSWSREDKVLCEQRSFEQVAAEGNRRSEKMFDN